MSSKEVSDGSTTQSTQDEREISEPENTLEAHLTEKPTETLPGTTLEAQTTEKPVGPPPDGGFAAWLQVLGAFLLFFNSWYVNIQSVISVI